MTALTTAADDVEAAYQAMLTARISAKQATATVKAKQAILSDLIKKEAAFVQHTSGGDRVKIELSPYDLTRGRIVYRHR